MLYFWIALAVIDVFIVLFLVLLSIMALRRAPLNILGRDFDPDSPMDRVQKAIRDAQIFFAEHRGEELVIEANGVELAARRYAQEKPIGRILMMHGYRSIAENDFSCAMDYYYSCGYELILVDQRAHGKSSGSWIGFGVLERYDCLSWLRYLNDEFGAIPTYLSGISMGCTTVLMASGLALPANVCGIIADCGFTSPKEIVAHVMKSKMHLPPAPLLPIISLFCRLIAGYSLNEYSTLDAMKINQLPILFIHGKEDHYVPPEMTLRNYEACIAEKELLIVDGAGHGTSYLQDREGVEKAIGAFLAKHNPR